MRKTTLIVLALALALAPAFGCVKADDETPGPETGEDTTEHNEETGPDDVDWSALDGTWQVTTELVDIDNTEMTPAADQPGATWTCAVDGAAMTLATDQHEYTGVLKDAAGEGWRYDATAEFADEDGATWTSIITVQAQMTGDDSFEGTMEGTIESDVDGHLYTATWDIVGTRQ